MTLKQFQSGRMHVRSGNGLHMSMIAQLTPISHIVSRLRPWLQWTLCLAK